MLAGARGQRGAGPPSPSFPLRFVGPERRRWEGLRAVAGLPACISREESPAEGLEMTELERVRAQDKKCTVPPNQRGRFKGDKLLKEEEIALKSCPVRQEMAKGSAAYHGRSTARLFIQQDIAKKMWPSFKPAVKVTKLTHPLPCQGNGCGATASLKCGTDVKQRIQRDQSCGTQDGYANK